MDRYLVKLYEALSDESTKDTALETLATMASRIKENNNDL